MKNFDKLFNKIINEYNEDDKILLELKKMAFCPYTLDIEQLIKNKYLRQPQENFKFFIDVNHNSTAIFGEYHFYYRIIDRCPHYKCIRHSRSY